MATRPPESAASEQEPQGEGADSEFDKAFAEFSSGDDAPAKAAAEDQPDLKQDAEPEPKSDPAKGADKSKDAAAASATPAAEASDDFDLATLPPAARTAFERLQQSERSQRGRVSALDRQLHQLRQRPATEAAPPAGKTVDNDTGKLLESDEVKTLRESYPEIAEPLIKIIEGQQKALEGVNGRFAQLDDERGHAFLDRQASELAELMPDWATWGGDARFENWITTQPRHVQEAASRNSQYIADAAEAHDVLSRFKAAYPAPSPAPTPTEDPKRQRQLQAGGDVRTRAPATVAGVPDDFDAAFDVFAAEQARKDQHR